MKIAFTGPEGSGKTTLATAVHEAFPGLALIPELVEETLKAESFWRGSMIESLRALRQDPEKSLYFQAALSVAKADEEAKIGYRVSDRTQMDGLAYTLFYARDALKRDEDAKLLISRFTHRFQLAAYDYIFYVPRGEFAKGDGRRETGVARIAAWDFLLRGLYQAYGVRLIELNEESVEGRLREVCKIIDR